jgi:hypothetical protein
MSIYSRVKCSPEELAEFKKKVLDYLIANGIDIKTIKFKGLMTSTGAITQGGINEKD